MRGTDRLILVNQLPQNTARSRNIISVPRQRHSHHARNDWNQPHFYDEQLLGIPG
jgi:hypothetical protein